MSDPSKHRAETPRASGSLVRRLVPAIIAAVLVTGGVTAAAVVDPFADDPVEPTRRTVGMSIGGAVTAQLLEDAPQPVVAGEKLRLTKARKAELFAQVVDGDGALSGAVTAEDVKALFEA